MRRTEEETDDAVAFVLTKSRGINKDSLLRSSSPYIFRKDKRMNSAIQSQNGTGNLFKLNIAFPISLFMLWIITLG